MAQQPPTEPDTPGAAEYQALALLADRLAEAGFHANVEPGPAFPMLSVLITGTRTLREMVLISSGHYTWDAGHAHHRIDDPAGAAAALARHIGDLGDRLAAPTRNQPGRSAHSDPSSPGTGP